MTFGHELGAPSGFVFSGKSIAEMAGVHVEITAPAHLALAISAIDFSFYDGRRSLDEQELNVAAGVSRTLDSAHLTGDAGDLVPWVEGEGLSWAKANCILVAQAMRTATIFLRGSIIWGGVFDRPLEALSEDLEREVALYAERWKKKNPGKGKVPFFDGPHFQRAKRVKR